MINSKILLFSISLCFAGFLTINAQEEEQDSFGRHIENLVNAMSAFEQELQKLQADCDKLAQTCAEMQTKYNTTASWMEKGKLKVELAFSKKKLDLLRQKIHKQDVQLHIYYCVLAAQRRHKLSSSQKQKALEYFSEIEKKAEDAKRRNDKARERETNARKRLEAIPGEITRAEERVSSLNKRLQVMEDKKTWGNLTDRIELKAKLSLEKSRLLKLQGEIILQEKNVADAIQEQKSLDLERQELESARKILKK